MIAIIFVGSTTTGLISKGLLMIKYEDNFQGTWGIILEVVAIF